MPGKWRIPEDGIHLRVDKTHEWPVDREQRRNACWPVYSAGPELIPVVSIEPQVADAWEIRQC